MEMQPAISWEGICHIKPSCLNQKPTTHHCDSGRNAETNKPSKSAARDNLSRIVHFSRAHQFQGFHGAHVSGHDEKDGHSKISAFKHEFEDWQAE